MFRVLARAGAGAVAASERAGASAVAQPARTAVNLSALKGRIRATKNVAKITNVMKMVASSKLKSVEDMLAKGAAFGETMFNAVALPARASKGKDEDVSSGPPVFVADGTRHLAVVLTTDRGLCGGVNSTLTRLFRKELNHAMRAKAAVKVVTLGDKGRAQVARDYAPVMAFAVDQAFDKDPVFPLAAALAAKIVAQPYDLLTVFFNRFDNQAKFTSTFRQIPQLAGLKEGDAPASLKGYDVEPEDNAEALVALQEYAVASALYYAMLHSAACETSQRVIAMDNATTNAKDMVHSLSLIYNRGRQAKITTELAEIVSGAEASKTVEVEE